MRSANPGKVNVASGGNGTARPCSGELFKTMAGINISTFRIAAGPALALCWRPRAGRCCTMPASIEYVRSGKLRALAVTTATRLEALPDIPTVGEF